MISVALALAVAAAPTPFPPEVYRARRERLAPALKGCIALLHSRTKEGAAGLELDPAFYWLTGVAEPGAAVLLTPGAAAREDVLLLAPVDPERERYTGPRALLAPALRRRYGFDDVVRTSWEGGVLKNALRRARCVARLDQDTSPEAPERKALERLTPLFELGPGVQAWSALERLQASKEERELERTARAVAVTVEGHRAAVRALADGKTERRVAQELQAAMQLGGATALAFEPIVATAENAAVLHWEPHDAAIRSDDVVVVDIGASFADYQADITRAYPVSGRFSPEQRRVYDVVLRAQQAAIDAVRPGVTFDRLEAIAERVIVEAGFQDGLVHGLGHFIGLEVHEPPYDRDLPLAPGMVLTVEPGVYLRDRRIGVRIEDMVLVTKDGARLLTGALPRSADEVERFVAAERARAAR